jgi:hypothetical protein
MKKNTPCSEKRDIDNYSNFIEKTYTMISMHGAYNVGKNVYGKIHASLAKSFIYYLHVLEITAKFKGQRRFYNSKCKKFRNFFLFEKAANNL